MTRNDRKDKCANKGNNLNEILTFYTAGSKFLTNSFLDETAVSKLAFIWAQRNNLKQDKVLQ